MITEEPRVHLWTRDEYYRMAGIGLFDDRRVELIEGQVVEMAAMRSPHSTAVTLAGDALRAVGDLWSVGPCFPRLQQPLSLGELSDPEPDVAVVAGVPRDYAAAHPTTALLVVEVAEASLRYDRHQKASLYARYGIQDYWIINLVDRQLEILQDPQPEPSQPYGFGYATRRVLSETSTATPLAAPGSAIAVADLLP